MDIFETIVAKAAGISSGSPLKGVLTLRSEILELTENSHEASLRPIQQGGLTHSERAGLACRICKHNNESVLARHYERLFGVGSQAIADTGFDGGDDARLQAVIRHTDWVRRCRDSPPARYIPGIVARPAEPGASEKRNNFAAISPRPTRNLHFTAFSGNP